jgi:sugar lactone lactonase YvrE
MAAGQLNILATSLHPFERTTLVRTALIVAGLGLAAPLTQAQTTGGNRVEYPDSIRAVASASDRSRPGAALFVRSSLRPEELSAPIGIELALRMRNFEDLQRRIAMGEVISRDELAAKYLPRESDYAKVLSWARDQKLEISREDPNRLAVFARASVEQAGRIFQVGFARVQYRGNEYTSAVSAPSVSAEIASALLGINGLQPHLRFHKHLRRPAAEPDAAGSGYTPAQIAKAYDATGLVATGAGETIAIVIDAYPQASDLNSFWSACGINRSAFAVTYTGIDGGPTSSDDADEATLDVEWSGAMAPGAALKVYGLSELSPATIDDACSKIYQDAQTTPGLHEVSISFGGLESDITPNEAASLTQSFATLASAGLAVFAASGDGGSNPNDYTGLYDLASPRQTEYPASDPDVTGVGGTSLQLASDGSVSSETGWTYSGGGQSGYFTRPDWQSGPGVSYYQGRFVPDVSSAADPNYGCFVIYQGQSNVFGGTSWGPPTWAGLCAVINQSRIGAGLGPLGFFNPRIYPLIGTANFRDITSGSNGAYQAGPGYDMVTGIGVPDEAKLLALLSGSPAVKTPPSNQELLPGATATFRVAATGANPLAYQWQRLPIGGTTWTNLGDGGTYSGSQTASLSVSAVTSAMNGDQFRCVVSNTFGSATSLPPADLLVYVPMTFVTYAGFTGSASANVDGPANQAIFGEPAAVSADSAGDVYVYDESGFPVVNGPAYRKITASGMVTTLSGNTDPGSGISGPVVYPFGTSVDASGNQFSADGTSTIQETTSAGVQSTFAGMLGAAGIGYVDGPIAKARFFFPNDTVVDSAGNVYVTDRGNCTIRKITPDGTVSTLAGAGKEGTSDGIGIGAFFQGPNGITIGPDSNFYVTDGEGGAIRQITPQGVVTTLAGGGTGRPSVDGTGSNAQFDWPLGLAFDKQGNLFVADTRNETIRKGFTIYAPQVLTQPANQAPSVVQNAAFTVVAGGIPSLSYSWQRLPAGATAWTALSDNTTFSGSATPTLNLTGLSLGMSGDQYRCVVANSYGSVTCTPAMLNVSSTYWFSTIYTIQTYNFGNYIDEPAGIAVDSSGNVYVSVLTNSTILKITPAGAVTNFAGTAKVTGHADGIGSQASFYGPMGMAIGSTGNLYVVDNGNSTIRMISPSGVVTTLAGSPGQVGSSDGQGSAARFYYPQGLTLDAQGNVYVADSWNHTIRKVTPAGLVTTVAGTPGHAGAIDGPSASALFDVPAAVAFDGMGNLYVADSGDGLMRKISPAGVVSTVPGPWGPGGQVAGWGGYNIQGGVAGLAADSAGNIYVANTALDSIEEISADGIVSTLGGIHNKIGYADGAGSSALFDAPMGITVDSSGSVYVVDSASSRIRKGVLFTGNIGIVTPPQSATVPAGSPVALSVTAGSYTGSTLQYQWQFNGASIPGATTSTLKMPAAGTTQAGNYTVVVTAGSSSVTSSTATLAASVNSHLYNISSRAYLGTGPYQNLVAGFFTDGSGSKNVVIRGIGPNLAVVEPSLYGLTLVSPKLTLFDGSANILATNTAWGGGQTLINAFANVYAAPLQANSTDTAVFMNLPAGLGVGYTAEVDSLNNATGMALVEAYDYDSYAGTPASRLINISSRALVGAGNQSLVAGFWIIGSTSQTLLIRAVGPGLLATSPGLSGLTLARPTLSLFDSSGNTIATNAGWGNAIVPGNSTAVAGIQPATAAIMAKVYAIPLAAGSADCAMVVTLPTGTGNAAGYTAQVSSADSTTGVALVEVYNVP